jgi:CheY-like chemotaxis protein
LCACATVPSPGYYILELELLPDNADIIELYSPVLKARYEVAVVTTVEEALEKVKEFKPDFVFLDVMLPGVVRFRCLNGAQDKTGIWLY